MNKNNEFLQSRQWANFQESVGRKTYHLESEDFSASIIEHNLPMVGKYFYCPRGPVMEHGTWNMEQKSGMEELIELAKKENVGWIRIEPVTKDVLESIQNNISEKIVKAPHDMQPKEVLVIDISKSEKQLLAEMKSKARYNIGVAKKKGVIARSGREQEFVEAFLALTKEMAKRQGIVAHPTEYYRKMIESFPSEMLKIYVAEFEDKIIAANLILFHEKTATYLHGASSDENRNMMAPFLLQWQQILDAKQKGCEKYDFGGVKITDNLQQTTNNWEGITKFKTGFSPETKPVIFPGSYDIILNSRRYSVYKGLQRAKIMLMKFRR